MDEFLNPVGSRNHMSPLNDGSKNGNPEEEEQKDFEEGTEDIPLPSKGVFYFPPNFLKEELHCRPLDFRDEDILTTDRFINDGSVFDKIVTAVIQDKGISAKSLVPVDRDTILLWLRAKAMGSIMSVEYNCPMCKQKNTATWDLSEIKIPEYDPEIYEELKANGELKIKTPQKELTVYIRVPLIEESKDTEKKFLKRKEMKKQDSDNFATMSLSLIVCGVEVGDKVIRDKERIMRYFEEIRLPIGDARYIRTRAKDINLQYDTKKDLICSTPECGHVQEGVEMPIVHQNFLWS